MIIVGFPVAAVARASGKLLGLWESCTGATSYLADILSYSRLLALGLWLLRVIAQVFNKLGSLFGGYSRLCWQRFDPF